MLLEAGSAAIDDGLRRHSEEVAALALRTAVRLGLDKCRRERLLLGALLHDVGKLGVSARILMKPGRLTPAEFAIIKEHPGIGHRVVSRIPYLARAAPAVRHHHERFDGLGYPDGLAGEDIPVEARIVAVVDAYSAMLADRPYRQGCSADVACAELERCAGSQFDPAVVDVFVSRVAQPASSGAIVSPASLSCSQ